VFKRRERERGGRFIIDISIINRGGIGIEKR